ncbi:MAG: hypothetical protein ACREBD_19555 [Blastocatellia bacterium]
MKTRLALISFALALIAAAVAMAADVNGKWTAQVPGRQGNAQETTFTFKVEGDKLTGTMSGRQGDTPIADGKVSGDEISFTVTRERQGATIKQLFKGKVAGDEIKFTRSTEGGQGNQPVEFTAKRVK